LGFDVSVKLLDVLGLGVLLECDDVLLVSCQWDDGVGVSCEVRVAAQREPHAPDMLGLVASAREDDARIVRRVLDGNFVVGNKCKDGWWWQVEGWSERASGDDGRGRHA
jgi:hypothetical protein